MVESPKFSFSVDPTKISKPLQLLAIVLGIIALAFIWAGYCIGQISFPLGLFAFASALLISIFVVYEFLDILKKTPWVFYSPGDFPDGEYAKLIDHLYNKKAEDYKEEKQLNLVAETTDEIGKTIEANSKEVSLTPEVREKIIEIIENKWNENIKTETYLQNLVDQNYFISDYFSNKIQKIPTRKIINDLQNQIQIEDIKNYYKTETEFLKEIAECLYTLSLNFKIEPLIGNGYRPDFAVQKSDGEFIPVEIKNFRQRIIGKNIPQNIANQMIHYMNSMDVDESVLILNSKISDQSKLALQNIVKPKIVHIIAGGNRQEIKTELSNIFKK